MAKRKPRGRYYAQHVAGWWKVFDRNWYDTNGDIPLCLCATRYTAFIIRNALNEREERDNALR